MTLQSWSVVSGESMKVPRLNEPSLLFFVLMSEGQTPPGAFAFPAGTSPIPKYPGSLITMKVLPG